MLRFYISCRPIRIKNELVTPREQFVKGFRGLDIETKVIAMDLNKDGRMVYEVIIGANSQYSDADCSAYQAIILEGLAAFGCHLKTLESAQALVLLITGKTYEISGDHLVIPAPPVI